MGSIFRVRASEEGRPGPWTEAALVSGHREAGLSSSAAPTRGRRPGDGAPDTGGRPDTDFQQLKALGIPGAGQCPWPVWTQRWCVGPAALPGRPPAGFFRETQATAPLRMMHREKGTHSVRGRQSWGRRQSERRKTKGSSLLFRAGRWPLRAQPAAPAGGRVPRESGAPTDRPSAGPSAPPRHRGRGSPPPRTARAFRAVRCWPPGSPVPQLIVRPGPASYLPPSFALDTAPLPAPTARAGVHPEGKPRMPALSPSGPTPCPGRSWTQEERESINASTRESAAPPPTGPCSVHGPRPGRAPAR